MTGVSDWRVNIRGIEKLLRDSICIQVGDWRVIKHMHLMSFVICFMIQILSSSCANKTSQHENEISLMYL